MVIKILIVPPLFLKDTFFLTIPKLMSPRPKRRGLFIKQRNKTLLYSNNFYVSAYYNFFVIKQNYLLISLVVYRLLAEK